jgi:tetratricopeptide (TPR) repeat protein
LISRSKYDQSATVAEQAVALGRACNGLEGQAIGLFVWGQALYWKGQRTAARARMEQALQLIESARANPPLTEAIHFVEWHARVWLRGIFLSLGEYESARSYGTRALQICQALGSRFGEVHSLCNLADVAREVRDLPAARQSYERALSLLSAVGYRWGEAVVQFELGDVVRLQGDYGRAHDLIERGLAVAREIGDSLEEARAAAYLGRLCVYMGDYLRTREALDQVLQMADALEAPELRVEGLLLLTILAQQTGEPQGSLTYAQQTYHLACEFSSRYTQAHALVLLGHAQADTQPAAAAATYAEAIARYQALGNAVLACEPRAGLAALALAHGDAAQALEHIETIMDLLETQALSGPDEPFRIYATCQQVLDANCDARAAKISQLARQRVLEYAATIGDTGLRRSFLERMHPALHPQPSAML